MGLASLSAEPVCCHLGHRPPKVRPAEKELVLFLDRGGPYVKGEDALNEFFHGVAYERGELTQNGIKLAAAELLVHAEGALHSRGR